MSRVLFDECESLYRQLREYTYILTNDELLNLKARIQLEIEERISINRNKGQK